jgi:hypothetical protein
VAKDANVVSPFDGASLAAGNTGLNRFWNSEWAGFTLSSPNGPAIDSAAEFATGYYTLTVSAAAGNALNLESLTFNSAEGGTTGDRGFQLYAAPNGGAINFGDAPVLSLVDETGTRAAPTLRTVDLTGAAYQNVDSITFRYYPLTPATGNSVDFTALTLNGTVAPIPEPGSLTALAAIALATMTGRRQRRAR